MFVHKGVLLAQGWAFTARKYVWRDEEEEEDRGWPDIHANHVFPVGLLHHVVDGVAAHKGDVDVIPGDDAGVVVVYGVDEEDVSGVRRLKKATQRWTYSVQLESLATPRPAWNPNIKPYYRF